MIYKLINDIQGLKLLWNMNSHIYKVQVRFNDFDSMKHVNHANYLSYAEQARLEYYGEIFGKDDDWYFQQNLIIARCEIDYKSAINLKDDVFVETNCIRLGVTSFELAWKIIKQFNDISGISAIGKSIIVCYDYDLKLSVSIPEKRREAIVKYEVAKGNFITIN